ncbi:hypothetical protein N183_35650 [Sinorhizobium sp. Sb3]|uniref:MmgE/PrpD family protein n=1 Tax=Sinorhizobium sp. Sb3 TaxID=1358417 RepID=UPI00072BE3D1|nr:MmgE/PrpD family protein [Sinorhizobium sp. Sb3]KSV63388.1 hypothetical protein N183_35650 [Sinorhizobium sp. Sb3]
MSLKDAAQKRGCPPEVSQAGIARQIATYVATAREHCAPETARKSAFKCILDLLGAAAAGINEQGVDATRCLALATIARGDVPIWFAGQKSSAIGAVWANSCAAAALDIDDGNRMARGHPGAAVIPVAFAVAHETDASIEDLVSAIVIGYEVGVTVGAARAVYGNTGTWSSYAVVAAAAALRRTPPEIIEHALAIAGESAPNQLFASATSQSPTPEGSDVKEGIPWSVVTGLTALGLAERGHTGPRNILDSQIHYRFPADLRLGTALHICNTYLKVYACCRHVHAPLEALLNVVRDNAIDANAIDAIDVETYSGALRISNKVEPANLVDIQYSIPYCLGLAALVGSESLLPLTSDALGRPLVSALAKRVTLRRNDEFDASFPAKTLARVTVTSRGQRFVSGVTVPKGDAADPLSWKDVQAKFRAVTRLVANEAEQERLLDAVDDARTGRRISALQDCLAQIDFTRPRPGRLITDQGS